MIYFDPNGVNINSIPARCRFWAVLGGFMAIFELNMAYFIVFNSLMILKTAYNEYWKNRHMPNPPTGNFGQFLAISGGFGPFHDWFRTKKDIF